MTQEIKDHYQDRLDSFKNKLRNTEGKIKSISIARLIIAIGMILSFYYGLTYQLSFFYLFFALIISFVVLIFIHTKLFYKKNLYLNYVRINKEELDSINGDQSSFDSGINYLQHDHNYAYDLDIFGKNSIFEFLCRTVTLWGKDKLASLLMNPPDSHPIINERQQAVSELKTELEFRQTFRAKGLLITEGKSDLAQLLQWLKSEESFTSRLYFWISILCPILTITAIIYSLLTMEWQSLLSISLLINGVVYSFLGKKINKLHIAISKKKIILDTYSELILLIEEHTFKASLLHNLQKSGKNASEELKKLANYSSWLDNRLNILYSPLVNLLFLHDLQLCLAIERWKIRNKDKVEIWLKNIAEFDVLNSIANMAYNHPDCCIPQLSDNSQYLNVTNIIHPLMNNKQAVANSFEIGSSFQTAILTGANMAGKSTFLRSLGVNLVLAYAGAPVFASSFKTSRMQIISTMRISDSLKDNTSYFYAELQRLKQIKDNLVNGIPCFILLDEILKGTNSNDKQKGSKAFVENLIHYPCIGMVATHDLELGILESQYPDKVNCFCFESFIEGNKLTFDYKIRKGLAQNTNASFLMKELGII